jgi:hypothetical protein
MMPARAVRLIDAGQERRDDLSQLGQDEHRVIADLVKRVRGHPRQRLATRRLARAEQTHVRLCRRRRPGSAAIEHWPND